jgi:hypothetical protein
MVSRSEAIREIKENLPFLRLALEKADLEKLQKEQQLTLGQ